MVDHNLRISMNATDARYKLQKLNTLQFSFRILLTNNNLNYLLGQQHTLTQKSKWLKSGKFLFEKNCSILFLKWFKLILHLILRITLQCLLWVKVHIATIFLRHPKPRAALHRLVGDNAEYAGNTVFFQTQKYIYFHKYFTYFLPATVLILANAYCFTIWIKASNNSIFLITAQSTSTVHIWTVKANTKNKISRFWMLTLLLSYRMDTTIYYIKSR